MPTATSAPTGLITKNLPVAGVKVLSDEEGIVEAFVAGIGNKDSVGDIIQPGAFVDSLKERTPKGCWSHQWEIPVSRTLEIREVLPGEPSLPQKMQSRGVGGLYVKTQFNLETQRGREAFSDVKFFGDESEWSIGYRVEEQEYSKDLKANLLHKIELYEYSPVLFGANSLTSTVSVKVGEQNVAFTVACDDKELEAKMADAIKNVIATEVVDEGKADSTEASEDEAVATTAETDESVETADPDDAEAIDDSEGEKSAAEDDEVVEGAQAVDTDGSGDPEVEDGPVDVEAAAEEAAEEEDEKVDLRAEAIKAFKAGEIQASELREKIVAGSIEARLTALSEALWNDNPNGVSFPVATFESSVVYFSYDWNTGEEGYYQASYSFDNETNSVTLGDERTAVDVVEIIVAKAAIMNAIWTGHGAALKGILAPLAETAAKEVSVVDDEVKSLLDSKAGRVLSQKNLDRLKDARDAISAVIEAAASEPESEEKTDTSEEIKSEGEGNEAEKPYHIEERDGEFCVIKDDDGKEMGCHSTRSEAEDQMAALYANEGDKSDESTEKSVTIDPSEWQELQSLLSDE